MSGYNVRVISKLERIVNVLCLNKNYQKIVDKFKSKVLFQTMILIDRDRVTAWNNLWTNLKNNADGFRLLGNLYGSTNSTINKMRTSCHQMSFDSAMTSNISPCNQLAFRLTETTFSLWNHCTYCLIRRVWEGFLFKYWRLLLSVQLERGECSWSPIMYP